MWIFTANKIYTFFFTLDFLDKNARMSKVERDGKLRNSHRDNYVTLRNVVKKKIFTKISIKKKEFLFAVNSEISYQLKNRTTDSVIHFICLLSFFSSVDCLVFYGTLPLIHGLPKRTIQKKTDTN